MDDSTIWSGVLDNKYYCRVERKSKDLGKLTVTDNDKNIVILECQVTLMYGALYGADVYDIVAWQEMIEDAVNNLKS